MWIGGDFLPVLAAMAISSEDRKYFEEMGELYVRRAMLIFSMTALLPDNEEWGWSEPLERQSGGQTIRYLAFPFGRYRNKLFEPAEAIGRVILGPKCTLSVDQTTSMLQACGFRGFQIARSNCQIR